MKKIIEHKHSTFVIATTKGELIFICIVALIPIILLIIGIVQEIGSLLSTLPTGSTR